MKKCNKHEQMKKICECEEENDCFGLPWHVLRSEPTELNKQLNCLFNSVSEPNVSKK